MLGAAISSLMLSPLDFPSFVRELILDYFPRRNVSDIQILRSATIAFSPDDVHTRLEQVGDLEHYHQHCQGWIDLMEADAKKFAWWKNGSVRHKLLRV